MTSTPELDTPSDRGQNILEWLQLNTRLLTIGALIVVAGGAGYWFYIRSAAIKSANADRSLMTARQSLAAGNTALARTDLQKVIQRYTSTRAAVTAAMLLAQVAYDEGKYQEGIDGLRKALDTRAASGSEASLHSLIGDGYLQLNKPADAAKEYERAAEVTDLPAEKSYQAAKAARAYAAAGKTDDARRLWSKLATDDQSESVAAEAKVRLAELDAKPAGKS